MLSGVYLVLGRRKSKSRPYSGTRRLEEAIFLLLLLPHSPPTMVFFLSTSTISLPLSHFLLHSHYLSTLLSLPSLSSLICFSHLHSVLSSLTISVSFSTYLYLLFLPNPFCLCLPVYTHYSSLTLSVSFSTCFYSLFLPHPFCLSPLHSVPSFLTICLSTFLYSLFLTLSFLFPSLSQQLSRDILIFPDSISHGRWSEWDYMTPVWEINPNNFD